MGSEGVVHVLMVSFPGQGHVNPLLRLAKLLASKGLLVTFTTTNQIGHMMQNATNTTIGTGQLRFEFFSDGWDDDEPRRRDLEALMHQLESFGKESLTRLIAKQSEQGRPVSCLINNSFVPWASDVATELGIPFAVLWVQSCAVFSAYFHYFHRLISFPTITEPDLSVNLPSLPTLKSDEIPSFLHPSTPIFIPLRNAILGQFRNISKALCVFSDTFEDLEHETVEAMSHLSPIKPVGPLFKSPNKASTTSVSGDMWKAAEDCLEWLDAQPQASVVYISFGSIVFLENDQMEELAWGLLKTGLPFLWVVKPPPKWHTQGEEPTVLSDEIIKEVEGKGKIVQWCPQEQVLAHPSIACFVTHCGWNSSMESLTLGVPVVAFPQWGDQVTNAKFLVEVYKVGVRMMRNEKEGKLVVREEVERCIGEVTRGSKAEEITQNALKWKKAAEKAVDEGGSSDLNIQSFVGEIRRLTQ